MRKKRDLAGQRFGRLLVLYDTGERKNGKVIWHCRCDCGNEVNIRSGNLISGNTTSCGCYNRERSVEAHTIHGVAGRRECHPMYHTWHGMLARCENPKDPDYKYYGGRGITVCEEWHNPQVFIGWALSNGWQKGLTLDRINNDGNYKPSNCRWATRREQARNMRSNRLISFNSKTQTVAAWAEEIGVKRQTLASRIYRLHWPIERALTEPNRRQR